MSNILITGADSFIGSNFIRYSHFRTVEEISLLNKNFTSTEFSRYDVILHLAGIVYQSFRIQKDEYFKINRDLCIAVAELAKKAGVRQFILLSTVKVFGELGNHSVPWDERSACNPIDFYGKSKLEAEIALKKLESPDFIVSIIRTPIVYGEGVRANMLSLIKLVEKCPVLPLGGINNKRNYTFAENLVGFIDRIIEKRASGILIAMDNEPISTTDLVKTISDALGKKITLFSLPEFLVRSGKFVLPAYFERIFGSVFIDNTRTREILDFNPPFTIEQGLRKMLSLYKK